jgi:hypothetical protein
MSWNFKDLSFYEGRLLIGVSGKRLTISETVSVPYERLDLLNGEGLRRLIASYVIFS